LPFPNPKGLGGANLTRFMTNFSTATSINNAGINGQYQPALYAGGYAMIARLTNNAQGITLAAELHWPSLAFFSRFLLFLSWVVVVALWIVDNSMSSLMGAEIIAPLLSTKEAFGRRTRM